MENIQVTINDKKYNLLLAVTEEEKEQGLQNVENMESDEGMFFDYRENPQNNLSFWMKDTTIPLDVIFVNEDDEVLSVHKGVPESLDPMIEKGEVYYVIELNEESGVKVGDEVEIGEDTTLAPNKMYVLNPDGTAQFELEGGERIFSRISTKGIIRKAKKAYRQKTDAAYKALGRYVFKELDAQTSRDPEYVKSRTND